MLVMNVFVLEVEFRISMLSLKTPLKLGQSDEIDNVNAPQTCMILGILWDETFKKA